MVDTPPNCLAHLLFFPDSKLKEELQALTETFSNFTATTVAEVKDLTHLGKGVGVGGGAEGHGRAGPGRGWALNKLSP